MTEAQIAESKNKQGYRSVIIDTINQIQNDLYIELLKNKGKATFDDWKDFGVEILDLYKFIKSLPNTVPVQVLGYEGTGKTVGGSFLDPSETVWLNADKKPLTFFGARQKYPTDNSKKNYKLVTGYDDVKTQLLAISGKSKEPLIVFILGHLEDYKSEGSIIRQRLKVLGKQATKQNIEGALSHTYYTYIDPLLDQMNPERYKLTTVNSGTNTARSPQGYWDSSTIPNNYQLIVDKILADW
jgi:hypothetical protein